MVYRAFQADLDIIVQHTVGDSRIIRTAGILVAEAVRFNTGVGPFAAASDVETAGMKGLAAIRKVVGSYYLVCR